MSPRIFFLLREKCFRGQALTPEGQEMDFSSLYMKFFWPFLLKRAGRGLNTHFWVKEVVGHFSRWRLKTSTRRRYFPLKWKKNHRKVSQDARLDFCFLIK